MRVMAPRIFEVMRLRSFFFTVACLFALCGAMLQAQMESPAASGDSVSKPLPLIRELLLEVEKNAKSAEAAVNEYTYHMHVESEQTEKDGGVKKTTTRDAESFTLRGVRVEKTVAINGKPLTPDETKKESERIDKLVEKVTERREKRKRKEEAGGTPEGFMTVSRVLELGTFSHPRRETFEGRSTIVMDYAGDKNAKTRNKFEEVFRDLVGTVWIDEADRVLVRGDGMFLNDFKALGGLAFNLHKNTTFTFTNVKVNDSVWLPSQINANGSLRVLLFVSFNGRFRQSFSDYRKFRTTTTLIPTDRVIGPDGQPVQDTSEPANAKPEAPSPR